MNTTHRQRRVFTYAGLVLTFAAAACIVPLHVQSAEQPGPEHKALEVWVGDWTYEGEAKASPFGPAGAMKGRESNRMILDGFVCEVRWKDEPIEGTAAQGLTLIRYDSEKKSYVDYIFANDGTLGTTINTVHGNVWTGTGNQTDVHGKVYKTKYLRSVSADQKTVHVKAEYSPDEGKTWMLWWEVTGKKVSR